METLSLRATHRALENLKKQKGINREALQERKSPYCVDSPAGELLFWG